MPLQALFRTAGHLIPKSNEQVIGRIEIVSQVESDNPRKENFFKLDHRQSNRYINRYTIGSDDFIG